LNRGTLIRKIGTPPPKQKLILADQDAYDIIARMMLKHKTCACDYSKIAQEFEGRDIYEVAENLFNFCKKNIQYKEEKIAKQYVSSPQTILQRGYCDCKGYALFCGGVLDALNRQGWKIKWVYRFASDDPENEIPGHVFIVITDGGHEIWLDPVLNYFNQDHWYPYYQDKKISVSRSIGCCGSDGIGTSTAQVGQIISKVSPALAVIPVIGWVAAGVGTVAGFFLSVFGSKYSESTGVRWLVQRFQYYVLNQPSVTSDQKVSESYTAQCQTWFSTVLGVPIYDQYRYHALHGSDPNTGLMIPNITRAQRANNYLTSAPDAVKIGVTYNDAYAATYAADQFIEPGPAGSWAGFLAAPSLIDNDPYTTSAISVNAAGQLTTPAGTPVTDNSNIILLAAAAVIALILIT
jgi:hypothetical protein